MGGSTRPGESQGSVAAADAATAAATAPGAAAGNGECLEVAVKEASLLLQEAEATLKDDREKAIALCQRALTSAAAAAAAAAAACLPPEGAASGAAKDSQTTTSATSSSSRNSDILACREEALRVYEEGAGWLAGVYAEVSDCEGLRSLLSACLSVFDSQPKSKAAKVLRGFVSRVAAAAARRSPAAVVAVCEPAIAWCEQERRHFLQLRLQLSLAKAWVAQGALAKAQQLLLVLLRACKRLEEKQLLVEVFLLDSEVQYLLKNAPKSRAALTAARTTANAIHCPPTIQGQLDLQAGVLHAKDKDYRTAFSYFFEAFEAFSSQEAAHETQRRHEKAAAAAAAAAAGAAGAAAGEKRVRSSEERDLAMRALTYMLLMKILMGRPEDVPSLLSTRQSLRYYEQPVGSRDPAGIVSCDDPTAAGIVARAAAPAPGVEPACARLEALRLLAISRRERSLKLFRELLNAYRWALDGDAFVEEHLADLYAALIEEDLHKTLQAYSRVELSHVARLMALPEKEVEETLCRMMLDGKLKGTLDQGLGVLVLFEEQETPQLYADVLSTVANMAAVVDALYEKAQQTL
ncbi:proteasome PCI domain-containing protein, putative [Eimeria brunetti]|uniref:Proteasome PCI domain-containing protein, putative n=1 Tax=Eimeria brunetti TaxID=51314 RepID=U6LKQ0_9EIME|nr:proteasome PCI domain-containing protein, putative [Eimeria brunetti]